MPTLHRRRNPVALAAILRKGGVHEKSRKAKRQKQKQELRKTVSKAMATDRGHSSFWPSSAQLFFIYPDIDASYQMIIY